MLQEFCTLEDVRKNGPGLEAGCMHEVDKEVAGTVSSVGVVVASRPVAPAQRTSELAWHGASDVSRRSVHVTLALSFPIH